MPNTLSQQQVEDFLRPYGFTGSATGGAAASFLASNPTANAAFNTYSSVPVTGSATLPQNTVTQWAQNTINPSTGLPILAAGQDATGGVVQNALNASPALNAAFTQFQQQQGVIPSTSSNSTLDELLSLITTYGQGGVMPLGFEPLHDWEKSALEALSAGNNAAQASLDKSNEIFAQIKDLLTQNAQPMTDDEFNQLLERYNNPYQEEVVNSTLTDIREQAANARARLTGSSSAGFGSSSLDRQLSELNDSELDAIRRASSGLNYEGFNSLVNTIENRANSNRSTAISAASALAPAAQGIQQSGIYARDTAISDLVNRLNAGKYVRDYNQQLADVASGEIQREQDYPLTQLQTLMNLLQAFQGGAGNAIPAEPNALKRYGDIGVALGDLLQSDKLQEWFN